MLTVDISSLRGQDVGSTLEFSEQARSHQFAELPKVQDLAVSGRVTLLDDNILVSGEVTGWVTLACSRCLAEFKYVLSTSLEEVFSHQPQEEEWGYEGNTINLEPILHDAIGLALPDRPLHDAKCQGLCPVCGKDLNKKPHTHQKSKGDNPFAALKKLKR